MIATLLRGLLVVPRLKVFEDRGVGKENGELASGEGEIPFVLQGFSGGAVTRTNIGHRDLLTGFGGRAVDVGNHRVRVGGIKLGFAFGERRFNTASLLLGGRRFADFGTGDLVDFHTSNRVSCCLEDTIRSSSLIIESLQFAAISIARL